MQAEVEFRADLTRSARMHFSSAVSDLPKPVLAVSGLVYRYPFSLR
jgi:hypothetical protein